MRFTQVLLNFGPWSQKKTWQCAQKSRPAEQKPDAEFDGPLTWPNGGIIPLGTEKNVSQSRKVILSRCFSSFLKICDRFLEATSKGYEKLLPPENYHLKMYFLLNMVVFQCHMSFQGCRFPMKKYESECSLFYAFLGSFQCSPVIGAELVGGLAYDRVCFSTFICLMII